MPTATDKGLTLGNDPLPIYKPSGTKNVDAAKATANFNGWSCAAVNAIASEVAKIQVRLFEVNGDDHAEVSEHELLDLLYAISA